MKKVAWLIVSCLSLLTAAAHAEPEQAKVTVEHKFDASVDTTWGKLGRFCAIAEWQSLVASCVVEERQDGIYRIVGMHDHTSFTERLEEYSHGDHAFTYTIKSGPLPIKDYRSEFRLIQVGDGQTRLVWKAWYTVPAGIDEKTVAFNLRELFANGIKGMIPLLAATR
ncbi:SRPBCC family protein [Undibacterium arcticum]|uniref:SRPBCC family protein n=1 Tax=Undibacterium arcticum TaxID=1762892 RepID=A0ABV7EYW3_9BURK